VHAEVNGTRLWFDVDGSRLVPDGPGMRDRDGYERYIRSNIVPALGDVPLRKLDPETLDRFYAHQRAYGGQCRACWDPTGASRRVWSASSSGLPWIQPQSAVGALPESLP
jgi:hypothetical protein